MTAGNALSADGTPPFVVVGNPRNRRVAQFCQAVERLGRPTPIVVSYVDLLRERSRLCALPVGAVLRIDSPGEDFEVERELLRRGIDAAEEEGTPVLANSEIDELTIDHGRLRAPRQWYLGYRSWLGELRDVLGERTDLLAMSHPDDIATMFDKPTMHARCRAAGIPVPNSPGVVRGYEELRALAGGREVTRLFVKLANGSSAAGVVAIVFTEDAVRAVTSAEIDRSDGTFRLYNSLRLRTYTDERDVAELVDALCEQRVHVEEWLPKANPGNGNVDLRVVVIGGRPAHTVVRQSRHPMTNLHLGNERGDLDRLKALVPPDEWAAMQATCARVGRVFPRTWHVGVDVAFLPRFRRHAVLEANAFGDLLPGVRWQGLDTYEAEVALLLGEPFEGRSNGGHSPRAT